MSNRRDRWLAAILFLVSGAPTAHADNLIGNDFDEVLALPRAPQSCDYNGDGNEDGNNFLIWQRGLSSEVTPKGSGADGDNNGVVDAGDLAAWQANFGATISSASSIEISARIPELAPRGLIGIALLILAPIGGRYGRRIHVPGISNQQLRAAALNRACFAALGLVAMMVVPAGAETTTIALSNQPVPEGNGRFLFLDGGIPVVNAAGQVAFYARLLQNTSGGTTDDSGIYLSNGSELVNLARENGAVPEGDGQFGNLGFPVLNAAGQVAFGSRLRNTSGGLADDDGIYLHTGATLANLARENISVPEGNGHFEAFGSPLLNPAGQVAYQANLKDSTGVPAGNGIYLHTGVLLLNRARENMAVPEGNGQLDAISFPTLNPAGQIAFKASLKNTSGGIADDSGVYLHTGATLVNRARENDSVPDGNGRFDIFEIPTINAAGEVAFWAGLKSTSGGALDNSGVYLHDGTTLVTRAREDQIAPEGNGRFSSFPSQSIMLNAAGHVAFSANLRNTAGGAADDNGIYLHNGVSLVNIARENAAAPDGNGQFSSLFPDPSFNAAGQVAFLAVLKNTSGIVNDNVAIYIADGFQQLKVVRRGDMLAGKTASVLGIGSGRSTGGEDGRSVSLNDFAQVAYNVQFTDGTSGVFLFTPELHWRSTFGDNWDNAVNWTVGAKPGAPHQVVIDPATSVTITGPSAPLSVKSLTIGGGAGVATLELAPAGILTSADGITVQDHGALTGHGSVNANVFNAGVVALGSSPGTIMINGDYIQAAQGKLQIGLPSPISPGKLTVAGNATLSGELHVVLGSGYIPSGGTEFDILDWTGALAGGFATVNLPVLPSDLSWNTSQLYTTGVLRIIPEPPSSALVVVGFLAIYFRAKRHTRPPA